MRSERLMLVLIAVTMIVAAVPLASDFSDASTERNIDGVVVTVFDDAVSTGAGSSVSTAITFFTETSNDYLINIACSNDSSGAFTTSVDDKEFTLNSKSPATPRQLKRWRETPSPPHLTGTNCRV